MAIAPRPEQLQALRRYAPPRTLGIRTEYADGRETDLTGAAAYGLYAESVGGIIRDLGGGGIWSGQARALAGQS